MYYHFVGTSQDDDQLVYENKLEPNWMFIARVSNDGNYLIISTTRNTDDIQLVSIADISSGIQRQTIGKLQFKKLIPDWMAGFTYLENQGTSFIFKTNHDAPMGRVVMIDLQTPQVYNWKELIPEKK